jgi:uncharacterized membrane protein
VLVLLAIVGILASSLALREHYRTDSSPCSINERWDCGVVNHSPYAIIGGLAGTSNFDEHPHSAIGQIPVAVVGILGYLFLGALAVKKAYRLILLAAAAGLVFSLYLARIEARILGVWCIYCVISLGVISLITLLDLAYVAVSRPRPVP